MNNKTDVLFPTNVVFQIYIKHGDRGIPPNGKTGTI